MSTKSHQVYQPITKPSEEELKQYYLPAIMHIVLSGQKPRNFVWDTGASSHDYYVLGELPNNKYAIYMDGRVEIISGRDSYGGPIFDHISYSAQSLKRFFGRGINVSERDLVMAVRTLIRRYK